MYQRDNHLELSRKWTLREGPPTIGSTVSVITHTDEAEYVVLGGEIGFTIVDGHDGSQHDGSAEASKEVETETETILPSVPTNGSGETSAVVPKLITRSASTNSSRRSADKDISNQMLAQSVRGVGDPATLALLNRQIQMQEAREKREQVKAEREEAQRLERERKRQAREQRKKDLEAIVAMDPTTSKGTKGTKRPATASVKITAPAKTTRPSVMPTPTVNPIELFFGSATAMKGSQMPISCFPNMWSASITDQIRSSHEIERLKIAESAASKLFS